MDAFVMSPNDKGLSIKLKREANIILASLKEDSDEYNYKKARFEDALSVIRSIEDTNPQNDDEINFIFSTINNIWNNGVLSPLSLDKKEFLDYPDKIGRYHNIRYGHIYKENDVIYNNNAFNLYVKAAYDHNAKVQLELIPYIKKGNDFVFISKGGIITGEYIEKCIIRQNYVDKHCFTLQSIVNIPVSKIQDGDGAIYVVDHREPKLKALQQFYDVPINTNELVASFKYNLRKYTKLNK